MKWTKEEIDCLLKIKEKNKKGEPIFIEKLKKIFPYRTIWSIRSKCFELKIKVSFKEDVKGIPDKKALKELLDILKVKKIE